MADLRRRALKLRRAPGTARGSRHATGATARARGRSEVRLRVAHAAAAARPLVAVAHMPVLHERGAPGGARLRAAADRGLLVAAGQRRGAGPEHTPGADPRA